MKVKVVYSPAFCAEKTASRLRWRLVDLCFWETDCSASSFHICGLLLVALHNSNVQDQIVGPFSKSLPSHRAVSEGTIGAETPFRWWGVNMNIVVDFTTWKCFYIVCFFHSQVHLGETVGSSTRHLQVNKLRVSLEQVRTHCPERSLVDSHAERRKLMK